MTPEDTSGDTKKPRVVIAEFDAWIQDPEELFDTTHEESARENEIFDEKMIYEPQPLLIGKGRLFQGLEKSMFEAEVGNEYEIILASDDAAGPRDPKLVELLPIREFHKQDIDPRVGLRVTIKNKTGYISAVTAGRVRVDFNNRLAGRTLKYRYKIISEPSSPEEIFNAILKMDFGSSDGFSAEFDEKKAIVKLPDVCKYDQRWLLSKISVVSDMRELLNLDTIQFIEEYAKLEEKTEDEEDKIVEEEESETPIDSTDVADTSTEKDEETKELNNGE